MSFLLFAVTALHVLILVLLFVATLDKAWWVLPDGETVNLWYDCVFQNSTQSWVCASVADNPGVRAVQGLLVGALLLAAAAFLLFLWQLQAGPGGRLFVASGATQI
ncbi:EMP3 protein, partial [Chunga burmeisteri]|nr:EMP3 protein [Chunga burmeisteri]